MASLSLPAPTRSVQPPPPPSSSSRVATATTQRSSPSTSTATTKPLLRAPSYEERCRAASAMAKQNNNKKQNNNNGAQPKPKLFVPRSLQDFDDGGAFPEIHVAQYPRHLGNPHLANKTKMKGTSNSGSGQVSSSSSNKTRAIVNVEIDASGDVSYDAIVKGGTNTDKIVYSRHEDLRGGEAKPEDVALPNQEEEQKTAQRTQAALNSLLQTKITMDKPTGSAMVQAESSKDIEAKTQFIKYTPKEDAPGYNPSAKQRVIQMVPAQVDPMMPPKHKHIKAPRGPAEDPVPILHAPPGKLSKEERAAWNIPACISNWKNVRGYTIPLDKRLAADGRGLREHTINSNFATLSESLYVAERQARQEVRMRAQVQKRQVLQEKQQREDELRQLANQARLERSGGGASSTTTSKVVQETTTTTTRSHGDNAERPVSDHSADEEDDVSSSDHHDKEEDTEEQVAAQQRERLRLERKRERERELRMENNMELKKQKLEAERDVSEKIALGVHTGSGGGGLGGQVDSRLYNQSAGMDSGFGADDEYNTYTKPLFGGDSAAAGSSSIYRPTRGETEYNADEQYDKLKEGATTKFQPDKGFAGADGGHVGSGASAGARTGPVQFEKGQGHGK